jgi:hypothetical protein
MRFFRKQPPSPPRAGIDGLVGYYGLRDWWLATFAPKERDDVESMWGYVILGERPLTQGHITHNPLTAPEFLLVLIRRVSSQSVRQRILAKVRELLPGDFPGYVNGAYYTTVMERAKTLISEGRAADADALVDAAFTALEADARIGASLTEPDTVPPANYRDFAALYRKHKEYAREVAILERYMRQPHGPGKVSGELQERLEKARVLLAQSTQ